jgi:hypothetical protein
MTSNRDSRVFFAYVCEGMALLGDGVPAAAVEEAAQRLGFVAGPLAAVDDAALGLVDDALHQELHDLEHGHGSGDGHRHEHGHTHTHSRVHDHADEHGHDHDHAHKHGHDEGHDDGHGHDHDPGHGHGRPGAAAGKASSRSVKSQRIPESAVYVLEKMAHGYKRLGRSAGAGFYEYEGSQGRRLWSGLKTFERGGRSIPADDVADRISYSLAIEAVRCLRMEAAPGTDAAGNGAGPSPVGADDALRYIDKVGRQRFVERARELANRYGQRFEPPPLLLEKAASGEPF